MRINPAARCGLQLGFVVWVAVSFWGIGQIYLGWKTARSAEHIITTQTNWNNGSFSNTEAFTNPGSLALSDAGTWSTSTIKMPDFLWQKDLQ